MTCDHGEHVVALEHGLKAPQALFAEMQRRYPGLCAVEELTEIASKAFEISDKGSLSLIGYGRAFLSPLFQEKEIPEEISLVLDLSGHESCDLKTGEQQLCTKLEDKGFQLHALAEQPHQLLFSPPEGAPWRLRVILVTHETPAPVENFTDAIGVVLHPTAKAECLRFVSPPGTDPRASLQAFAERKLYISCQQAKDSPPHQILLRVAQGWSLHPMSQSVLTDLRSRQLLVLIHSSLIAPFQCLSQEEKQSLFHEWKAQYGAASWWPRLVWMVVPHLPDALHELSDHPFAEDLLRLQKWILENLPDHPHLFSELLLCLAPLLHDGHIDGQTTWCGWRVQQSYEWPSLSALSQPPKTSASAHNPPTSPTPSEEPGQASPPEEAKKPASIHELFRHDVLGSLTPLLLATHAPLPLETERTLLKQLAQNTPLLAEILLRDAKHNEPHPDAQKAMQALKALKNAPHDLVLWLARPFLPILISLRGQADQKKTEGLQAYCRQLDSGEKWPPEAEELLSCPGLEAFLRATIDTGTDERLEWPTGLVTSLCHHLLQEPIEDLKQATLLWSLMAWICRHGLDPQHSVQELAMSYWLLTARGEKPEQWAVDSLCTRSPSFMEWRGEPAEMQHAKGMLHAYACHLLRTKPEALVEWGRVILSRASHDPLCLQTLHHLIRFIADASQHPLYASRIEAHVLLSLAPLIEALMRQGIPALEHVQLVISLYRHSDGLDTAEKALTSRARVFSSCDELQEFLNLGTSMLCEPKADACPEAAFKAWITLLKKSLVQNSSPEMKQALAKWVVQTAQEHSASLYELSELFPFCDWSAGNSSREGLQALLKLDIPRLPDHRVDVRHSVFMRTWLATLKRFLQKNGTPLLQQDLARHVLNSTQKRALSGYHLVEILLFCDWTETPTGALLNLLNACQGCGVRADATLSLWRVVCSRPVEDLQSHGTWLYSVLPLLGALPMGALQEEECVTLCRATRTAYADAYAQNRKRGSSEAEPLLDATCAILVHAPQLMETWLSQLKSCRSELKARLFPQMLTYYCNLCCGERSKYPSPRHLWALQSRALFTMMRHVAEFRSDGSSQTRTRRSPSHVMGSQDAPSEQEASGSQAPCTQLSLESMEISALLNWVDITHRAADQALFVMPALQALATQATSSFPRSYNYQVLLDTLEELLKSGQAVQLAIQILQRIPGIDTILLDWMDREQQLSGISLLALAARTGPLPPRDYSFLLETLQIRIEEPNQDWILSLLKRIPDLDHTLLSWIESPGPKAADAALILLSGERPVDEEQCQRTSPHTSSANSSRSDAHTELPPSPIPLSADFQWAQTLLLRFGATRPLHVMRIVNRLPEPTRTQALFEAQRLFADEALLADELNESAEEPGPFSSTVQRAQGDGQTEKNTHLSRLQCAEVALLQLTEETDRLSQEISEDACLSLIGLYGTSKPRGVLAILRRHPKALTLLFECIQFAQRHAPHYDALARDAIHLLSRGAPSSRSIPDKVCSWMSRCVDSDDESSSSTFSEIVQVVLRFSSASHAKTPLLDQINEKLLGNTKHLSSELSWEWKSRSLFWMGTRADYWEIFLQEVLSSEHCGIELIAEILKKVVYTERVLPLKARCALLERLATLPFTKAHQEQFVESLEHAVMLPVALGHHVLELVLMQVEQSNLPLSELAPMTFDRILTATRCIFEQQRTLIDEALLHAKPSPEERATVLRGLQATYTELCNTGNRILQQHLSFLGLRKNPEEAWFILQMAVAFEQGLRDLGTQLFQAPPTVSTEWLQTTASAILVLSQRQLHGHEAHAQLIELVRWLSMQEVVCSLKEGLLLSAEALPILLKICLHGYLESVELELAPNVHPRHKPDHLLDLLWPILKGIFGLLVSFDELSALLSARLQRTRPDISQELKARFSPIAPEAAEDFLDLAHQVLQPSCAEKEVVESEASGLLTGASSNRKAIPADHVVLLLRYYLRKDPSALSLGLLGMGNLLQPASSSPNLPSGMIPDVLNFLHQMHKTLLELARTSNPEQQPEASPSVEKAEGRNEAHAFAKGMKGLVLLAQRLCQRLPPGSDQTIPVVVALRQFLQTSHRLSPDLWRRPELLNLCALIGKLSSTNQNAGNALTILQNIIPVFSMIGDLSVRAPEELDLLFICAYAFSIPSPLLASISKEFASSQQRLLEALSLQDQGSSYSVLAMMPPTSPYRSILACLFVATHYDRITRDGASELLSPICDWLRSPEAWQFLIRRFVDMFKAFPDHTHPHHFLSILQLLLSLHAQASSPIQNSLPNQLAEFVLDQQGRFETVITILQDCIHHPGVTWTPDLLNLLGAFAYIAPLRALELEAAQSPHHYTADAALLVAHVDCFQKTFTRRAPALCASLRVTLDVDLHLPLPPTNPRRSLAARLGATAILPTLRDKTLRPTFTAFGPLVVHELTRVHTPEAVLVYLQMAEAIKMSCTKKTMPRSRDDWLVLHRAFSESVFDSTGETPIGSIPLEEQFRPNDGQGYRAAHAQQSSSADSTSSTPLWILDALKENIVPTIQFAAIIDLLTALLMDPRLSDAERLSVSEALKLHLLLPMKQPLHDPLQLLDLAKLALLCTDDLPKATQEILEKSIQWIRHAHQTACEGSESHLPSSRGSGSSGATRHAEINCGRDRLQQWLKELRDWSLDHAQNLFKLAHPEASDAELRDSARQHVQQNLLPILQQVHSQLPQHTATENQSLIQVQELFNVLAKHCFPKSGHKT